MSRAVKDALERWQRGSRVALARVEVLALFPILVLCAYAAGGPTLVVAAAMVLPALLVVQNLGRPVHKGAFAYAPVTQVPTRSADRGTMLAMLGRISAMPGLESACFVLRIDDWDRLERRLGAETARDLRDECHGRLHAALRGDDLVASLGPATFGVVLHPIAAARLRIRDAIADRLRACLAEPIAVGATSVRLTACIGHAALRNSGPSREDAPTADAVLDGAVQALEEARVAGPGSVRSFVPGSPGRQRSQSRLSGEVAGALASGAILPWFQPQLDMRTGRVAGFEALARWQHPALGVMTPGQFLPAVEDAGRMEDLGTRIRQQALDALKAWDRRGHRDLTLSVNACGSELRSPGYAEQVAWDLDAADIASERLIVEVLESVAADARDDTVLATLAALRSQGIGLDLDDFGVGQASLLSIRRFGVRRIKIDRSFVIGIDRDAEQQAMVGGIVSLGRKMGLDALAEGVETPEEQATLVDLGCAYVQGFGLARPMALSDTFAWLETQGVETPIPAEAGRHLRPAE